MDSERIALLLNEILLVERANRATFLEWQELQRESQTISRAFNEEWRKFVQNETELRERALSVQKRAQLLMLPAFVLFPLAFLLLVLWVVLPDL